MQKILESYLHHEKATGVLVAVNIDGDIETHSAGVIPPEEHQRPYYIYSISKTITAIAILKLCETSNKPSCFLEDPVKQILPHYDIPSDITVRLLLNHTSGLSDYFSQKGYQNSVLNHPSEPWSYERLMDVGLEKTPLFPAGQGWSYSNPGYAMLKEIIEIKSGQPYFDYIQEEIIDQLHLTSTRSFSDLDLQHQLLESADTSMDGDFRELYHPGWILTGCFISTVSEVTQIYQALFSGKLISNDSLRQMTELIELKHPLPKPRIAAYGLGLMSAKNDPTGVNFGHGGGGPGYTTYARHYPDNWGKQITISLVVNNSLPQTPFDLADQIFESIK